MPGGSPRDRRWRGAPAGAAGAFPLGAAVTLADLAGDPHLALARLRRAEPASWLPALNGWLVTRRDLAVAVLRDSGTFTVDDPRFTTARVVGPSMLSLDGEPHARHRAPFAARLSRSEVRSRLAGMVAGEAERLVAGLRPAGAADLRHGLARPLAVAVMAGVLGLGGRDHSQLLAWHDAIVGAVSALAGSPGAPPTGPVAAGADAFDSLGSCLREAIGDADDGLSPEEAVSNAAVVLFGGIETTEGMIGNALLLLLSRPDQSRLVTDDLSLAAAAVDESLRMEPAAAMVDRYATRDVRIAGAAIRRGELVSVSLAAAGRDPEVFAEPDVFDIHRPNAGLNLAFARGPHFCLGVHLARLEAVCAVRAALRRLPGLRLDPEHPSAIRGLVFRKPPSLRARWDPAAR